MPETRPEPAPQLAESGQARKPSVLFVYFTYTNQTSKVLDVVAEELTARGCEVTKALPKFTDPRYDARFQTFPMPHPFREVLGMIPAELSRKPGKIGIPDAVTKKKYDLVVFGSPTWWLSTNVPIRSFPRVGDRPTGFAEQAVHRCGCVQALLEAQPQDRSPPRHQAGWGLRAGGAFPL